MLKTRSIVMRLALLGTAYLCAITPTAHAEERRSVELPIKGPLMMIMTDAGTPVIVSQDGRFVLPGQFVDRADEGQVVASIDQAQALYGKAGHNKPTAKIERVEEAFEQRTPDYMGEDGLPNVDQLLSFSIGNGPKQVYMFVDPECPYCHKVVRMQADLGDRYTFHNLLVPLLGAKSQSGVADLACMSESDRQQSFISRQATGPITRDCQELPRQNVELLAMDLAIESVPTIIAPWGGMVSGAPRTASELIAFLESER